jgi:archaemetzincin
MTDKEVLLVAVGGVGAAALKDLETPLATSLGCRPVLAKVGLPDVKYAFNKDRGQYHTQAILRRLQGLASPGQRVLGVCDVDLFVPDVPFVVGEAERESRVALVSVFRLRQGTDLEGARRRLQCEAVHHAGHLLGLSFCEDARCVMYPTSQPADADRKNLQPCNTCRNELARLRTRPAAPPVE